MANELQGNAGSSNSGLTTYFVVWNASGQVWNGSAFATASAANRNTGAISATQLGTASGVYVATAPAFAAGLYSYALYKRIGGSPAESDTLLAGPGPLNWTGTADARQYTPAEMADGLIGRNIAGGSDGGRTVKDVFAISRNKVVFNSDSTFDVYDTDDTTVLWSGTYTRGSAVLGPLTSTDPTG